jgi:hypothetical protein
MPSWIATKQEIQNRNNDFDGVRRDRIASVEKITGRPLIVYAVDFFNGKKIAACNGEISIDGPDKVGFSEIIENLQGPDLDLLIHSPGGSAEAAEAIINLLRSKFTNIHVFVPDQAKSAATMMCCAADEIWMDEKSELGPIDPQMILMRGDGIRINAPAQAILDQFDKAKDAIARNPKDFNAWLPILQTYGPSLLSQCEAADSLSKELVKTWLMSYMFKDDPERESKANEISTYLADSGKHLSHARSIRKEDLQQHGMQIHDINEVPNLQSAVWDLYLAIRETLDDTGVFKLLENCHGAAYIRSIQQVQQIVFPFPPGGNPQGGHINIPQQPLP